MIGDPIALLNNDACNEGISVGSVSNEIRTLNAMLNKAVEWQLMGHASIKRTERYLHVAHDHLTEAIDGFSI